MKAAKFFRLVGGLASACLGWVAQAQLVEQFNPADYAKPTVCETYFELGKDALCAAKKAEINALAKSEDEQKACTKAGFKFTAAATGTEAKCEAEVASAQPTCKAFYGFTAKLDGRGTEAKCSYSRTTPGSAPGDYVGDCITVRVPPTGSVLKAESTYLVTWQEAVGEDRKLTLVPGGVVIFPFLGCRANKTADLQLQSTASELMLGGALRNGYSFGLLSMPYKYYPGSKTFTGTAPIGGYLGWRRGQSGSGHTIAAAFTLSVVRAETVDPKKPDSENGNKPTVTGTSNVPALSFATGVMFDILKTPRGKPFKAGVFVGVDMVSREPTIDYKQNRKPWIALQIGYDFTDN